MSQTSQYTIASIARAAANDIGMYSPHLYFQFEEWGIWGFREANFDFTGTVQSTMLEMNSLRVVNFPDGCIDWIKVGIKVGERFFVIGKTGDLTEYNTPDDCGVLIPNIPQPPLDLQPTGINLGAYIPVGSWWSQNMGCSVAPNRTPSSGLRNHGMFDVEGVYPNMRFRFSSELTNTAEIYLEYLSDGIDPCGETFIHPYMADYIREYIHYSRVSGNDNNPQALKQEKERKMLRSRKTAVMRMQGFAPIDLVNSMRRGFKLTTKV